MVATKVRVGIALSAVSTTRRSGARAPCSATALANRAYRNSRSLKRIYVLSVVNTNAMINT